MLFRKSAVAVEGRSIFRWGRNEYECLADFSLWLRLLQAGSPYWVAAGAFLHFLLSEDEDPALIAVRRVFLPRIPARFLGGAAGGEEALRK